MLRNTQIQTPCPGCANANNSLAIAYNGNGYVSSYTDTPGDSSAPEDTNFTWDTTRNLMLTRTDAAGSSIARTTTYTWDANFRLPDSITEGNLTTSYTYDSHGNVTQEVQTDTANNLSRTTTTAYTYSSTVPGAVLQMVVTGPRTDVAQTTTTAFYAPDATCPGSAPLGCRGQVNTVTNALGQITTVNAYNAAGKPLQITDPNGLVVNLGYDTRERLTSVQVGNETTQYQYDAVGNLTQLTRPNGSTVVYGYDAAHRLNSITLGDGSHITYTLDANGDVTQEQIFDGSGNLTYTHSKVYDALGRLSQDVGAYNETVTNAQDAHNNVTSKTGPRTDISDVTSYEYDPLNRVIQATQADGAVDKMAYDALGHLTQLTDPDNQGTQYTPDAWGDDLKTVSADTGTTTRTFDAAGNLVASTDAMGQVTTYAYDALNRVTSKSSSAAGTPSYTFVYDTCTNGVGKLCTVEDNGTPTIQFSYDAQERLASRTDVINGISLTVHYTYEPGGALASITYPSGQVVDYSYDAEGRVSQVSLQPTGGGSAVVLASHFTYNPFAGPASFTFGNGAAYVQTLDQDYRPTVQQSGPWVKSATYDQASDLHTLTDASGSVRTYGYDATGRLTSASDTASGGFGTRSYTYDLNGNRTSVTRNAATSNYTYTPPNQLVAAQGDNFQYNSDGDMDYASNLGTISYDGYGRPTGVQDLSGDSYAYNAFNERKSKEIPGGGTDFVYGQDQEMLVEQTAGGPEQDYVYLYGKLLARLDSTTASASTVYYIHTDARGTPQAMTNSSEQIVWEASYTPFGTVTIAQQDIVNNLRFPGQYYDQESGIAYNSRRYYDQYIGRYIEADPLGLAAGTTLYAYASGNPINRIDPLGLDWQGTVGISGTLFGLTAGAGGGVSVGVSTDGSLGGTYLFATAQANAMGGAGAYAGVGLAFGGGHTNGPPVSGLSQGLYGEGDFGAGGAASVNAQVDFGGNFNAAGAGPTRFAPGFGFGAMAGAGVYQSETLVSPSVAQIFIAIQSSFFPAAPGSTFPGCAIP